MSGNRPYFYNRTIRNLTVTFGNLFNEISIKRYDKDKTELKTIEVPIAFAPKQKWIARLNEESSISGQNPRVKMTLPRLGFNFVGLQYDPARKQNTLQKRIKCDGNDPSSVNWHYQPVPYNFNYELYVMTKNMDDMTQIVEQITPFFTPYVNIPVKDNFNFDEFHDIPLTLNDTTPDSDFEGNFDDRREILWTLSFTFNGYLYGVSQQSGFITKVESILSDIETCEPLEKITTTPDPENAGPEDDYGFTIDIEEL